MSASQEHVTADTPMGATLVAGGATFRVWAPRAAEVYLARGGTAAYRPAPQDALVYNAATGHWTGFFTCVTDGSTYRYYVVGRDGFAALKRDPRAAELQSGVPLADCDCVVRDFHAYPWHDAAFVRPAFSDLVVYQFHVGVFFAQDKDGRDIRPGRVAKLLDALGRVADLADLGVTALQPEPIHGRIRRRPVLGGLINEYEPAA